MTSTLHFRLWLLLGGILVVLLCRGFKALPGKSGADPKTPKAEAADSRPAEGQKESPPASP